jgi:hypothetical protein
MATEVFVFGSNLEGYHGAGAAQEAFEHHGAIMGQGEGLQGNSYAIPTKGKLNPLTRRFRRLDLEEIREAVETFKLFAQSRTDLTFRVTKIGCGFAGYSFAQIAPLFQDSPRNVKLPLEFQQVIGGQ